uniref:Uncharacterized protein n=1 Tax=Arundo donax TaxID=35708 RepID=A0A0A9CEQ8_ARUDO
MHRHATHSPLISQQPRSAGARGLLHGKNHLLAPGVTKFRACAMARLAGWPSLGADAERELELLGGDLVDPLAFPRRDSALVELELRAASAHVRSRAVKLHGGGGAAGVDKVVCGRRRSRRGRHLEADPPAGVDRGDVRFVVLRDRVRVLEPAGSGGAGRRGDGEERVQERVDDGVPVGLPDLGRPRRRRRRERRRHGGAAGDAERREVGEAPEEREQGGGGRVVGAVVARGAREARRRRAGVVGRHRAGVVGRHRAGEPR